jgi:undecaprenyl-phosphate alpha-N-acetylglucosaminyl 1-phosphatetransferase
MSGLGWPAVFVVGLTSGVAVLAIVLVLSPLARRLGLEDYPDARKRHTDPVPMVGGLALFLVLVTAVLIAAPPLKLIWMLGATSIIVIVGFLDDVFELGAKTRLLAQVVATLLMIFGAGLWIRTLGISTWGLDSLGIAGGLLTLFAVVSLTNAFNMIDGMDGLAAGHVLVAVCLMAGTMAMLNGAVEQGLWVGLFASAVAMFWLINMSLTPLRKVFLGDAGSLLLGFVVAWMLIYYTQEPVSALLPVVTIWCVTIPVFDTVVVVTRRIRSGQSALAADRNHLHHLLLDMGMRPCIALSCMLGLSLVCGFLGIAVTYGVSPIAGLCLYAALLVGYAYLLLHPELDQRLARWLRLLP